MPFPPEPSAFSQFFHVAQLRAAAKLFCVLAQRPKSAGEKPGAGPIADTFCGKILKGRVSPARQAADILNADRGRLPGICTVVAPGRSLKHEIAFAAATEGAGRSEGFIWQ